MIMVKTMIVVALVAVKAKLTARHKKTACWRFFYVFNKRG